MELTRYGYIEHMTLPIYGPAHVGFELIGNILDVVSLAKASMVSKLWKHIFGEHSHWKNFYLNSSEYRMLATHYKVGPWRILYGEFYNKYTTILCNRWKIKNYIPGNKIKGGLHFFCDNCFYINEKLVMHGNGIFIMLNKQLTPQEKNGLQELGLQKNRFITVKSKYTMVVLPETDDKILSIISKDIDRNYLYVSSNQGPVFRWRRNEFPIGCSKFMLEGPEYSYLRVHNEVIYNYRSNSVIAQKGSEKLWEFNTENKILGFHINDYLGAFYEFDQATSKGNLYLWDSQLESKPKKIECIIPSVLLGNEAIILTEDEIIAHSLIGPRTILKIDCRNSYIISNSEQNRIYMLTEHRYLTSICIEEKSIRSKIDLGNVGITSLNYLNGILYCVNHKGRLLLIHPEIGLIRKGKAKMFAPETELGMLNGKVLGVNWDRNGAVVISSSDSKKLKNKWKERKTKG